MFKTARGAHEATARGDATREQILDGALRLFRKRGFEQTTMREVAKAAKVSLGAAYYYFPSKEALVHAFFERVQVQHQSRVEAESAAQVELPARVRAALLSKLDLVGADRLLLGALFRYVGEADHALSVFGDATRTQREAAIAAFSLTLEGAKLSPPLRDIAARALWLMHLGLLLNFIHDRSLEQQRTRQLAARVADLFCMGLRLAALPGASKLLEPLLSALAEAGLTAFSNLEQSHV